MKLSVKFCRKLVQAFISICKKRKRNHSRPTQSRIELIVWKYMFAFLTIPSSNLNNCKILKYCTVMYCILFHRRFYSTYPQLYNVCKFVGVWKTWIWYLTQWIFVKLLNEGVPSRSGIGAHHKLNLLVQFLKKFRYTGIEIFKDWLQIRFSVRFGSKIDVLNQDSLKNLQTINKVAKRRQHHQQLQHLHQRQSTTPAVKSLNLQRSQALHHTTFRVVVVTYGIQQRRLLQCYKTKTIRHLCWPILQGQFLCHRRPHKPRTIDQCRILTVRIICLHHTCTLIRKWEICTAKHTSNHPSSLAFALEFVHIVRWIKVGCDSYWVLLSHVIFYHVTLVMASLFKEKYLCYAAVGHVIQNPVHTCTYRISAVLTVYTVLHYQMTDYL